MPALLLYSWSHILTSHQRSQGLRQKLKTLSGCSLFPARRVVLWPVPTFPSLAHTAARRHRLDRCTGNGQGLQTTLVGRAKHAWPPGHIGAAATYGPLFKKQRLRGCSSSQLSGYSDLIFCYTAVDCSVVQEA